METDVRRRCTGTYLAITALLSLSLTACGTLFGDSDESAFPEPTIGAGDPAGIPYDVDLDVTGNEELKGLLEQSSELRRLEDKPPLTISRLETRADRDKETFQTVLRSEGYYASDIKYSLDRDAQPIKIEFKIETGPAYTLAAYDIRYVGPTEEPCPKCDLGMLGLKIGQRARAAAIVDAQNRLVRHLEETGYPLAEVRDRKAVVHHDTQTMNVTLTVDQGPLAGYGPITVEGAGDVSEEYIRRLVPLEQGERYDQNAVDDARARLAETNLFDSVQIEHAETVNEAGNVPMTVHLAEGPHRSIGGSASYSTTEGPRVDLFWEHRNLFSENEKFRITGTVAEIEQGLTLDFTKPHFGTLDQNLLADFGAVRRTTDAFDELSVGTSVALERPILENWRVSGGLSTEYSVLTEDGEDTTVLLFGLPLTAARDDTDDVLDPREGSRLAFTLTPYYASIDENFPFLTATAAGSAYYPFDEARRYVLAGRTKIGTIFGGDTEQIPANKRFYAGGGGSVRGYEFQTVGPLDDDGDPEGGRSVFEVGAEMRVMVTETIGIVPFIDGGMVYDSPYPDDYDLLWAAGIGARYHTPFGPFRVDFAFPINGRKDDDIFQFYVSLGQAF